MDRDQPPTPRPLPAFWRAVRARLKELLPILFALLGGFVIGGLIILAAGHNPLTTYLALLEGAVGDQYNLASTLGRAIPIMGCGIAAALAFKAGLFNIGIEGQLVLGGLAASVVALYFPPGPLAILVALLAALIAGGLWALLAGWFETQFNVPILISTLMMNYIAVGFTSYMIAYPLIEPGGSRNQTPAFPEATRFAKLIPGSSIHIGIILIILAVILAAFIMYRTVSGYELRMFGANRQFAVSGGIRPTRMVLAVMFCSGMVAGLTGAIQVLGVHYRLIDTALTLPSYAWTGVMAAILSNNNPIGVVIASLFFSAVQTGAAGMERATEVPFQLSYVVQALMIILIAVRATLKWNFKRESWPRA
jgi:general nucleoside transport system permease protein